MEDHDVCGHLSIQTYLVDLKQPEMVIVDLVADTGSTDREFADQQDRMQIDRWVWMMPPKFVEKVVDFQNFRGEVGCPREGVLL